MTRIEQIQSAAIQARALTLLREGHIGSHSWAKLLVFARDSRHQVLHNSISIALRRAQSEFYRARNGWRSATSFSKGEFKKAQRTIVIAIQREALTPMRARGLNKPAEQMGRGTQHPTNSPADSISQVGKESRHDAALPISTIMPYPVGYSRPDTSLHDISGGQ